MDPLLLKALGVLQAKCTPAEIMSLLQDGAIAKALADAKPGAEVAVVEDMWHGTNHGMDAPKNVTNGPPQAASGGGAEHMTRTYSDPDPQMGLTRAAEGLGRQIALLENFVKSLHGQVTGLSNQQGIMKSVLMTMVANVEKVGTNLAALSKAMEEKGDKGDKGKDEEEDEMEKSILDLCAKAESQIAKAKTGFEAADEKSGAKAAALREEAVGALTKAGRMLKLARTLDEDAPKPRKLMKALVALAKAEDVENQDEWADEKRPGDDTPKGTGKAVPPVAAGASAGSVPVLAAPPAAAGLSAEQVSMLEKAIAGNAMLTTTVNGLYDMVSKAAASGQPAAPPAIHELFKADPQAATLARIEQIGAAEEKGLIDENDAYTARELVSMYAAVAKGHLPAEIVQSRLASSPESVKQFFSTATA